jgi:hypothetical protein
MPEIRLMKKPAHAAGKRPVCASTGTPRNQLTERRVVIITTPSDAAMPTECRQSMMANVQASSRT